jgi:hypothetical protein
VSVGEIPSDTSDTADVNPLQAATLHVSIS